MIVEPPEFCSIDIVRKKLKKTPEEIAILGKSLDPPVYVEISTVLKDFELKSAISTPGLPIYLRPRDMDYHGYYMLSEDDISCLVLGQVSNILTINEINPERMYYDSPNPKKVQSLDYLVTHGRIKPSFYIEPNKLHFTLKDVLVLSDDIEKLLSEDKPVTHGQALRSKRTAKGKINATKPYENELTEAKRLWQEGDVRNHQEMFYHFHPKPRFMGHEEEKEYKGKRKKLMSLLKKMLQDELNLPGLVYNKDKKAP